MAYIHGAYASVLTEVQREAAVQGGGAFCYVGYAPVHHLPKAQRAPANEPVLVHNAEEAKRLFGWDADIRTYTLLQAVYAHFLMRGGAPVVFINAFDPDTAAGTESTDTLVPVAAKSFQWSIANAGLIDLASITLEDEDEEEVPAGDVEIVYRDGSIFIRAINNELIGQSLSCTYTKLTAAPTGGTDIIGEADETVGKFTGIYAIRTVYDRLGVIPGYMVVPSYSAQKTVHDVMKAESLKNAGHWDMWMLTDLVNSTDIAYNISHMAAAKAALEVADNESVYSPDFLLAVGGENVRLNASAVAASLLQRTLEDGDGIPWHTASNTEIPGMLGLVDPAKSTDDLMIYPVETVNKYLNANGIGSAAYAGGRWVLWGAHAATYSQTDGDTVNVADVNRMMLYYISNDFQNRRMRDVDKPMTANDIRMIVAEEQTRLDALIRIGALTYGECYANATLAENADIVNGDFTFAFRITATPLAKSLTANVMWTDAGFTTYYESFNA